MRLETARLTLQPVSPEDGSELLDLFRDADVRRYLLDDRVVDAAWVAEEVENSKARFEGGSGGLFAIREKERSPVIGFTGYRPFFDPPELQLLYGLLPPFWGRGYATEAAARAIRFGFVEMGLDVVIAATDGPNTASVAVMERLGMSLDKVTQGEDGETVFYRLARA